MFKRLTWLLVMGLILVLAACNQDSDSSARFDVTAINDCVALATNEGCIGDFVWNDIDQDGIQDDGEPGIPNVKVILGKKYIPDDSCAGIDASGKPNPFVEAAIFTMTAADGSYVFVDLKQISDRIPFMPGRANDGSNVFVDPRIGVLQTEATNIIPATAEYCLIFEKPAVFVPTLQDAADPLDPLQDEIDSDADPTTGATAFFTHNIGTFSTRGDIQPQWDAGFYQEVVVTPSISIRKTPDLQTIIIDPCPPGHGDDDDDGDNDGDDDDDRDSTINTASSADDDDGGSSDCGSSGDDDDNDGDDDRDSTIVTAGGSDDDDGGSDNCASSDDDDGDDDDDRDSTLVTASSDDDDDDDGGSDNCDPVEPSTPSAEFTITVINDGDVALQDVQVTDIMTPACDLTIGNLAVDEEVEYTCVAENVVDSFTNVAFVKGFTAAGQRVDADDSAEVIVESPPPPPAEPEGCTPGFWKNNARKHGASAWSAAGIGTGDSLGSAGFAGFSVRDGDSDGDSTEFYDALRTSGGSERALMRHSAAAMLNALHPNVSYALSATEVAALVNNALAGNTSVNSTKNQLANYNEDGCSLNQHGDSDDDD